MYQVFLLGGKKLLQIYAYLSFLTLTLLLILFVNSLYILLFAIALAYLGWGYCLYLSKSEIQEVKEIEALRIIKILSHQRHDWMNHVQIIFGYLTLKKYEKIKEFLGTLSQQSNEERLISDLRYAPLAVFLLTLPYQFIQWTIKVKLMNMFNSTIPEEKTLLSILELFYLWLEKALKGAIVEKVTMNIQKDTCLVATILVQGNGLKTSCVNLQNDFKEIRDNIRRKNSKYSLDVEEDQITFTFKIKI
jgi:hypothetical protein